MASSSFPSEPLVASSGEPVDEHRGDVHANVAKYQSGWALNLGKLQMQQDMKIAKHKMQQVLNQRMLLSSMHLTSLTRTPIPPGGWSGPIPPGGQSGGQSGSSSSSGDRNPLASMMPSSGANAGPFQPNPG